MLSDPGLEYGSQQLMSEGSQMVMVPWYVGVPRLSHQFPAAVVVVGVVVATAVVVGVVALEVVVVGEVVVCVVVDVVVDELQDASDIAATSKTLRLNQINFVFNLFLHFK